MRWTGREGRRSFGRRFGTQSRQPGLQTQGPLVQLLVRVMTRHVQQVIDDSGIHFNLVRCLLEMLDLADHMSDLVAGKGTGGMEDRDIGFPADYREAIRELTILILEKLRRPPSSVKLGVPSSMKDRSVRYIPR